MNRRSYLPTREEMKKKIGFDVSKMLLDKMEKDYFKKKDKGTLKTVLKDYKRESPDYDEFK
jgi:hypothetical protein